MKKIILNFLIKGVGIFTIYELRTCVFQGILCLLVAQFVITVIEILLDWFGDAEIRAGIYEIFPKISKLNKNGTLIFGRPFNFVFKLVVDFFKADFSSLKKENI